MAEFDSTTWMIIAGVIGYLVGSISFAIVVSKFFRQPDPRGVGSGNPGATNMLRTAGKLPALLTLIGDFLKGWLVVILFCEFTQDVSLAAIAGLFVFIGHLYPVYFGFRGGKGVATAAGVLIAFSPVLGAIALLTWLLIVAVTRYVSLASMISAVVSAVAAWLFPSFVVTQKAVVTVMCILLVLRHHANIRKLLNKQESKIFQKKPK